MHLSGHPVVLCRGVTDIQQSEKTINHSLPKLSMDWSSPLIINLDYTSVDNVRIFLNTFFSTGQIVRTLNSMDCITWRSLHKLICHLELNLLVYNIRHSSECYPYSRLMKIALDCYVPSKIQIIKDYRVSHCLAPIYSLHESATRQHFFVDSNTEPFNALSSADYLVSQQHELSNHACLLRPHSAPPVDGKLGYPKHNTYI